MYPKAKLLKSFKFYLIKTGERLLHFQNANHLQHKLSNSQCQKLTTLEPQMEMGGNIVCLIFFRHLFRLQESIPGDYRTAEMVIWL